MPQSEVLSRRHFCFCCLTSAAFSAANGWVGPSEVFAEAGGLVSMIKDAAAASPIITHKWRDGVSALEGSGENIAVLSGADGKALIDAGIGVSHHKTTRAPEDLGGDPVIHLINTHWHFDHTDGNTWVEVKWCNDHRARNIQKDLSTVQRVEDLDYNCVPPPPSGIPSETFATECRLKLNGSSLHSKRYVPAHTDGDISVTFAEANIVHVGDTFLNGIYPFFDYSTGGSIDGMIAASDANLAATTDKTIIIPSHGKPVSNRAELKEFRDMLRCGPGQRCETQEAGTIT
jgi:glyoxylase-like metal-dependent hydrolase (beta-lactamase superfamily II)